jgi:hypothetical protein
MARVAAILGPRNLDREGQKPDMVRPASTDHGTMMKMKWSLASYIRIEDGGLTRQTIVKELPTSVRLAGMNICLEEGIIRELHCHQESKSAYAPEGRVRSQPSISKAVCTSMTSSKAICGISLPAILPLCKVSQPRRYRIPSHLRRRQLF